MSEKVINRENTGLMGHATSPATGYEAGFHDGLAAAVDLGRAGAGPDQVALLLADDPATIDIRAYSDYLGELRAILSAGDHIFSGGDAVPVQPTVSSTADARHQLRFQGIVKGRRRG